MKRKLVLALVLLAALVLLWLAVPGESPIPQAGQGTGLESAQEAPALQGELPESNAAPVPTSSRQELDLSTLTPGSSGAILRGRSVDAATGEPLPGCLVTLTGQPEYPDRMDAWQRQHGDIEWDAPDPVITKADGVFAIPFVPLAPYWFRVELALQGRVPMQGNIREPQAGTVVDLGDVLMEAGHHLTGIVVDPDGIPQAGVRIRLRNTAPLDAGPQIQWEFNAVSEPDGRYEIQTAMAAGTYMVRTYPIQLLEPERMDIDPEEPGSFLRIVVPSATGIPPITGTVIDTEGRPIAQARIRFGGRSIGGSSTTSHDDGSFSIVKGPRDHSPESPLFVDTPGHEFLLTEETYSWGDENVVLTVSPGKDVEILVLDSATGEPVEDYGVRCFTDPNEVGRGSIREMEIQETGHHEAGLVTLPGVREGITLLVIEPTDEVYLRSPVHRFEMTDLGAPRQVVRLSRNVRVTLEVVKADGVPVAGTAVDLWRPGPERPIGLRRRTSDAGFGVFFSADQPLLLVEGKTDEKGRVPVIGPTSEMLTLRVLGPGHPPILHTDLVLDSAVDPLRVVVPAGATLTGRVVPRHVLETFTHDVTGSNKHPPGIRLRRTGSEPTSFPIQYSVQSLDEQGRFALEGIPTGTWNLEFSYVYLPDAGAGTRYMRSMQTVADLHEGETRNLEVDIASLERGTLQGRIFLNGKSAVPVSVGADGYADGDPTGQYLSDLGEEISPSGAFVLDLLPGTYNLRVSLRPEDSEAIVRLRSPDTFRMDPGGRVDSVFMLETGHLRIRVLGSDGETPVQLDLYVSNEDRSWRETLRTDAEGQASIRHLPVGPMNISAFPRNLATTQAMSDYKTRTGQDAVPTELITAEVKGMGEETVLEIILPAEMGY